MEEIDWALDILSLPKLVCKADIKSQYYFFSKKYHPDFGGDTVKMEQVNMAYGILTDYIEGFRYTFDEDEINRQFSGIDYANQFRP